MIKLSERHFQRGINNKKFKFVIKGQEKTRVKTQGMFAEKKIMLIFFAWPVLA